jgi:K+-sensing histidine kinase KdpD
VAELGRQTGTGQVELTIYVDRAQIRAGSKFTSVGGRTELRDPILRYGVALCIAALAAILRGVLGAHFPGLVPFVTFFPAVLAVTLLAGLGPGLLATGLSAYLAWFFWLQPAAELPPAATDVTLNLILFVLASVLLVVTAEAARRYHGRCLATERRFRAA